MAQFVVFVVPDIAWEGIDYLYNLIELTDNNLRFALVNATTMEQARRKYFDNFLYPKVIEEYKESVAQDELENILESYSEEELVNIFGKTDGELIWNMVTDDEEVTPKIAHRTVTKLTENTIKELCYMSHEYSLAVSRIAEIIK